MEISFDEFSPLKVAKKNVFPLDALPLSIREMVEAVADNTQTDPAMAASVGLGVISVVAQGHLSVEGKADYVEPTSMYFLCVASPGERKSAVFRKMTQPIEVIQKEIESLAETKNQVNNERRRAINRKISALSKIMGREYEDELNAQIIDAERELAEIPDDLSPRLYTSDCTAERLEQLLCDNDGVIGVLSSEGGIIDIVSGRYAPNKIPNIEVWLKAHDAETITVDRIGRATLSIPSAHLAAVIMAQPEVLTTVLSNTTLVGRGLLARFLFSCPETRIGMRQYLSPAIDSTVVERYTKRVKDIYSISEHRVMRLSQSAVEYMVELFDAQEQRLKSLSSWMRDWSGKYIGTILRLAGLIAVCQDPDVSTIDRRTLESAYSIADYYRAEADYLAQGGLDQIYSDADYLASLLAKYERIKRSELYALCPRSRFPRTKDMDPALDMLREHGYIAYVETERQAGVGRQPAPMIAVNPQIRGRI